ncbi:hypothetical protein AGMMS49992_08130 [Clostridia bacterium]|nr:hypothetical protein AGMMS49992_08130 [Clostridia bacterium]
MSSGFNRYAKSDAPLTGWRAKFKQFKGLEWIVLAVLLCIVASVALSDFSGFSAGSNNNAASGNSALETRLAAILSSIDGAGTVDVMIYEASSATSATVDWLGGVSNSNATQTVGVVIVADGAADIRVRLELVHAVQTLMDLPANAVEVFQRKVSGK